MPTSPLRQGRNVMDSPLRCGYTDGKAAGIEPRIELSRPQVRCVFRRDSGSLTFDVPPSETSRWRAVARVLRSPMDSLSCALLPSSCALCGYSLDAPVQAGPSSSGLCKTCRLAPPPFVRAVAYGPYEGRMRVAIH